MHRFDPPYVCHPRDGATAAPAGANAGGEAAPPAVSARIGGAVSSVGGGVGSAVGGGGSLLGKGVVGAALPVGKLFGRLGPGLLLAPLKIGMSLIMSGFGFAILMGLLMVILPLLLLVGLPMLLLSWLARRVVKLV